MIICYKISERGLPPRLYGEVLSKRKILTRFLNCIGENDVTVFIDNSSEAFTEMIQIHCFGHDCYTTKLGNSGANLYIYQHILAQDDPFFYISEDDYLYAGEIIKLLTEGLSIADYVTLYDHPDKYMNGVNPFVKNGGEDTKVYLTPSCHWKETNSTTMTFAGHTQKLREDLEVFKKYHTTPVPQDFKLFSELRNRGRRLVSCIPGRATHLYDRFLCPLVDWRLYAKDLG